jgi:RAD51-like protein 2
MTKLSSLPLRPSTLSVLNRRGFSYFADVETSKSAQLGGSLSNFATELEIPLAQAANIAREVDAVLQSYSPRLGPLSPTFASKPIDSQSSNNTNVAKDSNQVHVDTRTSKLTAASLLSSSQSSTHRPIISFVQAIDAMLGGGFNPHEVTEVVGLPGVGKTQLAMQLCVDATIPHVFGGVEGESVYIDSEGSFSPERVCGMAGELVSHLQSSARKRSVHDMSRNESRRKVLPDWFTVDSVMESIHVMRVLDEACQAATIFSLPTFLKKRKEAGKQVKMVVIDSIAFHYRVSSCILNTFV